MVREGAAGPAAFQVAVYATGVDESKCIAVFVSADGESIAVSPHLKEVDILVEFTYSSEPFASRPSTCFQMQRPRPHPLFAQPLQNTGRGELGMDEARNEYIDQLTRVIPVAFELLESAMLTCETGPTKKGPATFRSR